jgi:hypothetical protein
LEKCGDVVRVNPAWLMSAVARRYRLGNSRKFQQSAVDDVSQWLTLFIPRRLLARDSTKDAT